MTAALRACLDHLLGVANPFGTLAQRSLGRLVIPLAVLVVGSSAGVCSLVGLALTSLPTLQIISFALFPTAVCGVVAGLVASQWQRARREKPAAAKRGNGVTPQQSFPEVHERGQFGDLRVAIVHDFLYVYAGAERVLEQLITLFPQGDLFALFDHLPVDQREFLRGKQVTTSPLQHFPFVRRRHRAYLSFMPMAIEQLDVSAYDLVVSSSYLAAKGVITGPDQLHISYCHSPARYAWDLQHEYLRRAGLGYGPRGLVARLILHYLRTWDARSSLGVDHFISNSRFVARRIEKCYRRKATVVHAPVDTHFFVPTAAPREDYYIAVGRMVPYKRTDLVVAAFTARPELRLKVIGTGPEFDKVRRLAGPNIELLGYQDANSLRHHLQRAKALVFAGEEDFGIVPVEAMACGIPVIAYGKGGVTESVSSGLHGVMFPQQTVESLLEAVDQLDAMTRAEKLSPGVIRRNAERFSTERFLEEMTAVIETQVAKKWPERVARREITPSRGRPRQSDLPASTRFGNAEPLPWFRQGNWHSDGHAGPDG